MSTPTSVPVTPSQPNQAQYNISDLALFHNFNRTSYLATFGVQAPPYDSTKKTKGWFDSTQSGKTGTVVYNVVVNGTTQVTQLVMTCEEAATPNLEGDYQYPAFVAPSDQTVAVQGLQGDVPTMINAADICMYADALALSQEMGVAAPIEISKDEWPNPVNWGTEARRAWAVTVNGKLYLCAPLIVMREKNGVGSPGSWNLSDQAGPSWSPTPEPNWGNLQVQLMPIRALLPNETLILWGMISATMVQRTDMQPVQPSPNTNPVAGAGTALTAQQAAQLQAIFDWVQKQST